MIVVRWIVEMPVTRIVSWIILPSQVVHLSGEYSPFLVHV
jgi:hypothetical protein